MNLTMPEFVRDNMRWFIVGAALIVDTLGQLPDLVPYPQPATGVTYAEKIDKSEARVDWTASADIAGTTTM